MYAYLSCPEMFYVGSKEFLLCCHTFSEDSDTVLGRYFHWLGVAYPSNSNYLILNDYTVSVSVRIFVLLYLVGKLYHEMNLISSEMASLESVRYSSCEVVKRLTELRI